MITTTPPSLQTWIASAREALVVDAYTIISKTGFTVRWISADFDFTLPDGRTFVRGPIIEREKLTQTIGLSVDPLRLKFKRLQSTDPQIPTVSFGAQSFLVAAQEDILRGATCMLERLVFDVSAAPLTLAANYKGLWQEFAGTLNIERIQNSVVYAEVLSETVLLDTVMPRDLYQPMCRNQVFDPQCGLSVSANTFTGAVTGIQASTTGVRVINTNLSQASGYFDRGALRFTSGPNSGVMRTVKQHLNASGQIIVAWAWPFQPSVGNTFTVTPGCDGSRTTCINKFNNLIRYRGEPFIPAPETVT